MAILTLVTHFKYIATAAAATTAAGDFCTL